LKLLLYKKKDAIQQFVEDCVLVGKRGEKLAVIKIKRRVLSVMGESERK